MTMEIIVKNNSENYIGKVVEIDHLPNVPNDVASTNAAEHLLNPGESVSLYVYDCRSIRVEEVEEIMPEETEDVDGTDESESGESDTEQPT